MIVKPSIQWLNTDTDAELINDTTVVIQALTANVAIYPNPAPKLADVQLSLNVFSNALAAAACGGPPATTKKIQMRLLLVGIMRQLAAYVQVACGGNMTNLLLSGFPAQKPNRAPIGVLPAPSNLTLSLGSRSGELDGAVNPVFGASIYNWKLTPTTAGAPVMTAQTTAASCTFAGLTPGATYTLTVNAVGAAGPSNWSQTAPQMAV
jgi:hypothetical protein